MVNVQVPKEGSCLFWFSYKESIKYIILFSFKGYLHGMLSKEPNSVKNNHFLFQFIYVKYYYISTCMMELYNASEIYFWNGKLLVKYS